MVPGIHGRPGQALGQARLPGGTKEGIADHACSGIDGRTSGTESCEFSKICTGQGLAFWNADL